MPWRALSFQVRVAISASCLPISPLIAASLVIHRLLCAHHKPSIPSLVVLALPSRSSQHRLRLIDVESVGDVVLVAITADHRRTSPPLPGLS